MSIVEKFRLIKKVLTGKVEVIGFPNPNQGRNCPVCKNEVNGFNRLSDSYVRKLDEAGFIHSMFQFETFNMLDFICPKCMASDRDRLYALFFENFAELNEDFSLLDIAPSKSLQNYLFKKFPKMKYRSADLFMDGVDDKIDITDMSLYKDASFDFFICSHVIEHVTNDRKAISELFRILKPGGAGILMAPILMNLKEDFEKEGVETEKERWKYFGQGDHVRIYSKEGFLEKLNRGGFKVISFNADSFPLNTFKLNGISERSVLYTIKR